MHDATLGAAADRASHVESRGLWRAARQNERRERLELLFARVDRALELRDALVVDTSLRQLFLHFDEIRRRQDGAEPEEIALDRREDFVDAGHGLDRAGHADARIELVDGPVCLDARIVLEDAPAA